MAVCDCIFHFYKCNIYTLKSMSMCRIALQGRSTAHAGLHAYALDSLCISEPYSREPMGRIVKAAHDQVPARDYRSSKICTYAGASALACWLVPTKAGVVSTAAPAACFGLFVAGILLPRLMRKTWEVVCLTPFAYMATVGR